MFLMPIMCENVAEDLEWDICNKTKQKNNKKKQQKTKKKKNKKKQKTKQNIKLTYDVKGRLIFIFNNSCTAIEQCSTWIPPMKSCCYSKFCMGNFKG